MAGRSAKCILENRTKETLRLDPQGTLLSGGAWSPEPPATCGEKVEFGVQAGDSGTEGQATYRGPNGTIVLTWSVPGSGPNGCQVAASATYNAWAVGSNAGADATFRYFIDVGDQDGQPTAEDIETPDDHTHEAHAPIRASGPVVLSPKRWLIDIAWQAVNHVEWDALILEITENRHGEHSAATCPGNLISIEGVVAGSKGHERCTLDHGAVRKAHEAQEARYAAEKASLLAGGMDKKAASSAARAKFKSLPSDFHSWCGDYITWVFWKAWMLGKRDDASKEQLKKFLNREAVRGKWAPGENLSYLQAYAQKNELLAYHPFSSSNPAAYVPQPGDVVMVNRKDGGHISMLAFFKPDSNPKAHRSFITLDGKSFDNSAEFDWGPGVPADKDPGWNRNPGELADPNRGSRRTPGDPRVQGVAETQRNTADKEVVEGETLPIVRAWIDTSKVREMLGYR